MIIAKIIGGLGNQMFQYAVARHLSLVSGEELVLDLTGFDTYTLHSYSMQHLNIVGRPATKAEVERFAAYKPKLGRRNLLYNLLFANKHKYVLEPHYHFDPSVLAHRGSFYMDGYWQSENYFIGSEAAIRADFTLKSALSERDKEVMQAMKATTQPVSVHVRRKDFAHDPKLSAFHGTCSPDYYDRAVKMIAERTGVTPHLFIFSDDAVWAREHLHFPYPMTYVDHNDASRNYADMHLMRSCQHHVLANSSFSWWGAWLNPSTSKIVIAPKRWTNDANLDTRDLIPPEWQRI